MSCRPALPPLDTLPTPTQTEELLLRSSYSPGPLDVLSPVGRLPPEILCDIFMAYSSPSPEPESPAHEMENISKSDLSLVSHVCTQWRILALGTPRLWSDIAVDLDCWPQDPAPFLQLLRTSLERGARHPLTFSLRAVNRHPPPALSSAFELLAEHSSRWQSASFEIEMAALVSIRHIEGKLGMLERLSLMLLDPAYGPSAEDIHNITIFETAPRLRHVRFSGSDPHGCPKLPWKQLRSFTYDGEDTDDIRASMALILNLSHPEAAFEFRGFDSHHEDLPLELLPITCDISSFLFELITSVDSQTTLQVFGDVLGCLTLPRLRELAFARMANFWPPLVWPVSHFESLSLRSSFCDTLRILDLHHVTITPDDLVRSLASLGALERLVISDQQAVEQSPDHVLITDALLLHLTSTPDSSDSTLVPNLNYIGCTSFCNFAPDIYFDIIESRIEPGRPLFQAVLCHLGPCSFEFPPEVHLKLLDLVKRRELRFLLE
ncbi:hypothetical protein C8R44DRAFT_868405 [Mycena epipterygia]|nr:hypothetical protein C8R44DRAFT_868405 [Mycena epipterygia]